MSHFKTCNKCQEEKSIQEFYKNSYSKDGYQSTCKKCRLPTEYEIPDVFKSCSKCKIKIPSINFNKNKQRKDGLNSFCKDCERSSRQTVSQIVSQTDESQTKFKTKQQTKTHLRNCRQCKEIKTHTPKGIYCKDCTKQVNHNYKRGILQSKSEQNKIDQNKICYKCEQEKSLTDFYKKKNSKDGYNSQCKDCDKQRRQLKRQQKRKEQLTQLQKYINEWYEPEF